MQTGRLTLRSALALIFALILMPSVAQAVSINSLKANATTIGKYEKYELTFNLTGVTPSNYNPFRPETSGDALSPAGVDVWADVTTPSGATKKVWGFYDVDMEYLGNSSRHPNQDRWVPVSSPHWKVRYAPMELGEHRITVRVRDSAGTASSSQLTFNCVESNNRGFITTSADDSRFVFSDGSPYVPFGMMMPYGSQHIGPAMDSFNENGINFVRRWLVNRDQDDIYRDLEGWYSYPSDSNVYRTGQRSAYRNISGPTVLVDQSFIGVKPDTYYKAFAYIRTSSNFDGQAAVSLVEDRVSRTVERDGNTVGGGRDWTYSEVTFRTASDAQMIHFKPRVISGSAGTVWIDDVGLYECDAAGNIVIDYNMVFNPSFEQWNPSQLRMVPLARFEYLLQMGEANGVAVQPAIFDYRLWHPSNPTGFYARFFDDWWTDSESIAQQDRVLRYLVARYAHYRSLFAWELTNEMDSSYTEVRRAWISDRSNKIRSGDPYRHLITNSYWHSPADHRYAQMPEIDISQVHYYINTEERIGEQGYPTWWHFRDNISLDTNPSNAASGNNSLRMTASGSTMSKAAIIYCQPNRSYTLTYKVRTSNVSGEASVIGRFHGGSSPGSGFTLNDSGTQDYTTRTRTFTTGSTATHFEIILQLSGTSGTVWWDDVEVIDNTTGLSVIYNGGFEAAPYGDDEFEWGLYNTFRTRERYEAGANGRIKAWGSGEFGLMGAHADLSYWARPGDNTKPRKDSTGIHVHNCNWAQLMASSALNTPTYWWVSEYILPYDLYGVWRGATKFASVLPFYERGQLLSTESIAEVIAVSSNPRIRLLGQKQGSNAYFWIQNRQHTWSRVVREGLSPTPTSADLTIPGFSNGSHTVEWYDTYTGNLIRSETVNVTGGELKLSVSSLAKDVAVIVRGESQQPQPNPQLKLVLTADKTTAQPSDVVTYTLTYTNEGNGDAANVDVTLPIPANTAFVPGSASAGGTYDSAQNVVRWTVPLLAPGASGQCSIKVTVL